MEYPDLKLISHQLCPYVQRSVITLAEKEVPFQRVDVELENPPAWFSELSPLGRVPLLLVNEKQVLFESAVICEFLEEITEGQLHPQDALEKATHRSWIEFGSELLNDIARLYHAKDAVAFEGHVGVIRRKLEQLETVIGESGYFVGHQFHLVDAVYGPIFRYFDVLTPYLPTKLFHQLPKIEQWRANLARRSSVVQAVDGSYPNQLVGFIGALDSHLSHLIRLDREERVVGIAT